MGTAGEVRVAGRREGAALHTYGRGAKGDAEGSERVGTCQGIRTQDLPAKAVRRCWRVFSWGVRAHLYFGKFPLGVGGERRAGGARSATVAWWSPWRGR